MPVPLSPPSRTVEAGVPAIFWSKAFTARIGSDSPTMRSRENGSDWRALSSRTSRRSRVVSSALSTRAIISSISKGLMT